MLNTARKKGAAFLPALLLAMIMLLQGCPIAVVAIVAAYSDDGSIAVTVEVPRAAQDVFEAAKKRLEAGVTTTGIPYKVTEIDEENLTLALEGTDSSWQGEFIVVPIGLSKSQILAQGTDDNRSKDESEHLILIGVENLCNDLGVEYTVIGRRMSGGSLE